MASKFSPNKYKNIRFLGDGRDKQIRYSLKELIMWFMGCLKQVQAGEYNPWV